MYNNNINCGDDLLPMYRDLQDLLMGFWELELLFENVEMLVRWEAPLFDPLGVRMEGAGGVGGKIC